MGGDYVPKGNHGYDPASVSSRSPRWGSARRTDLPDRVHQPDMHAIFCAHGVSVFRFTRTSIAHPLTLFFAPQPFANSIKTAAARRQLANSSEELDSQITVVPGFQNLEIYDLVAKLLGIPEEGRAPTHGTGLWERYLES